MFLFLADSGTGTRLVPISKRFIDRYGNWFLRSGFYTGTRSRCVEFSFPTSSDTVESEGASDEAVNMNNVRYRTISGVLSVDQHL
jgi:hypothetical protein